MSKQQPIGRPARDVWFPLCFVVATGVLVLIVYSGILHAPFLFDDVNFLENDRVHITSLTQISDILFGPGKRRVGMVTFALSFWVSGLDPYAYHLGNLLIHWINGLLVYLLIVRTLGLPLMPEAVRGRERWIAALASAIWLVHPVNTMAVSYTVQRYASLCSLFMLVSLLLYLAARAPSSGGNRRAISKGRSRMLLALSAVSALLAFGTKEIALCLPFLLLLYELVLLAPPAAALKNAGRGVLIAVIAVIFVVTVVVGYLGPEFLSRIEGWYEKRGLTPVERLLSESRVIVYYVSLLVFPHPSRLNVDYDFPPSRGLLDPVTTLFSSLLIVAGVGFLVARLARGKNRLLGFAVLWFLIGLSVESTIMPLDLVFEHRLYLPIVAPIALLVGWLLTRPSRRAVQAAAVGCVAVIVVLSTWTIQRNKLWADPIALWQDNAEKSPGKARVYGNLGKAYLNAGDYANAERSFLKVIKLDPDYLLAYNNLAVIALDHHQNLDAAEAVIKRMLEINPEFPGAYLHLGVLHLRRRQLPEAERAFLKVLSLDKGNEKGHYNLAATYYNMRRLRQARTVLELGLQLWPQSSGMYGLLALTCFETGDQVCTQASVRRALELDPDNQYAGIIAGKLSGKRQ